MDLHYGLFQPLRIYESREHQNRNRVGGEAKVFSLLMPTTHLLPFQIKRPVQVLPFQSIKAVPTTGGAPIELMSSIDNADLKLFPFADYDYLVHYGQEELSTPLPTGEYDLEIWDGVSTWYSEVITVKDFDPDNLGLEGSCALTKVTYWDTCDVAGIFYRTHLFGEPQYKNIFYLDIDVGKPEYPYTEEGDEDGLGNFTADFKKLEKEYLLQPACPEFFVDALALLPMHIGQTGAVEVLTGRGYTGRVDRISVSPKWQGTEGLWAVTDLVFTTEYVLKANCCDSLEMPIARCIRTGLETVATILEGSADYNNFEYTSAYDGSKVPLVDGDVFLREGLDGIFLAYVYNAFTYSPHIVILSQGNVVIDLNKLNGIVLNPLIYRFWGGTNAIGFLDDPTFTIINPSGLTYIVAGMCWDDITVEIWEKIGTTDQLNSIGSGVDYNSGGISYQRTPTADSVYCIFKGLSCTFGESGLLHYTGIGTMIVEGNFIPT